MTHQGSLKTRVLNVFFLFIAVLPVLIAFAAQAQQDGSGRPSAQSSAAPVPTAQARILNDYGKLPLSFEANHGQTDKRVKFLSRTGGYTLFLTGDEAVMALSGKKASTNKAKIGGAGHPLLSSVATAPEPGGVLRMKLRNANPAAKVTGVDDWRARATTSSAMTRRSGARM